MAAKLISTKADIASGLARGLVFAQRSRDHSQEIAWVDELIAEGKAYGYWAFIDGNPINSKIRLVRGRGNSPKKKPSRKSLDDLPGEWWWDRPSRPNTLLPHLLFNRGPYAAYVGVLLRRLARERSQYPIPLTPAFICDLATNIADHNRKYHAKKWRTMLHSSAHKIFEIVMRRLEDPPTTIQLIHPVDHFLAWHGLAPLPPPENMEGEPTKEEAALRKMLQDMVLGEEDCDLCGHLPEGDRPAMRKHITKIPLKLKICDKCLGAFWKSIAGSKDPGRVWRAAEED